MFDIAVAFIVVVAFMIAVALIVVVKFDGFEAGPNVGFGSRNKEWNSTIISGSESINGTAINILPFRFVPIVSPRIKHERC